VEWWSGGVKGWSGVDEWGMEGGGRIGEIEGMKGQLLK
jgi:hypothetical protein